ncbi:hypothetical protein L21SP5_03088 [Salinivirga cyanobacteriivorans]|uniref:T9SS C-terminal target domain-containing protein n=1 Tax=Salinivirga cyanobacteriivorans TaxID=1307839 RepID=A0A0S2I366_9BACT|nr:hypothetical protein [Salinivirga cyanobacteriivorans]ALO16708.1 hypothetical protein L21SP5_03088 [Salinivirga cyanobacteriivorans]
MKNKLFILGLIMVAFGFVVTSCDDDDDDNNGDANTGNTVVTDNISENTTWTSENVYELAGRITVLDGATLTIEPGTIIKGQAGTDANATALLVARGGTLMAEGTASAPIIFTSVADEITPEDVEAGNFASPNLDPDINGLWGGVIVLGKARISAQNENDQDATEVQIEGIPTSDTNGLYGGSTDDDNSGVIRYVSIRHGGSNIGAGNEINGLTLGGVGSGTTVEYVEVVANQDDGIEWFGGTVDVSKVVVWNPGDDGLDTDQAWNGTCSDFIVVAPQGSLFELDGPEGSYINGNHTFNNGIAYAGDLGEELIDFDGSTNVDMSNIYFFGVATEDIVVESYADMAANGGSVTNFEYTLPDTVAVEAVFLDIPANQLTEVASVGAQTVGPATTGFSWTWAAQSGALSNLGL